jgi:hypothetical protein
MKNLLNLDLLKLEYIKDDPKMIKIKVVKHKPSKNCHLNQERKTQ